MCSDIHLNTMPKSGCLTLKYCGWQSRNVQPQLMKSPEILKEKFKLASKQVFVHEDPNIH